MIEELKKKWLGRKTEDYLPEIRSRNYHSFTGFSIVGCIISLLILLFGTTLYDVVTFHVEFFLIFCYFVLLFLIGAFVLKRYQEYITIAFYIAITPLMFMGILMGTFLDRTEPSITIMVFLCVLTLFIIDKPWRIITYITTVAIVYCICCYIAKDYVYFVEDFIDLVAFYCLGVGVNFFILNDRIDSVENFVMFRKKSEIDPLTGIYNRGAGVEKIEQLLKNRVKGSFVIIDIDDFKQINDTYGHAVGDVYLQELSSTIKMSFNDEDIVLRLGGDEFAVYSPNMIRKEECIQCYHQFYTNLKKIKIIPGYTMSVSLGSIKCEESVIHYEDIYQRCDDYLYEAKKSGKGCYQIKD